MRLKPILVSTNTIDRYIYINTHIDIDRKLLAKPSVKKENTYPQS